MARFKQRIDEHSSISPSGFTGYIVKNSNVIIDKSYIEKGTSLINVFDNSNALLKDCRNILSKSWIILKSIFKIEIKIKEWKWKKKITILVSL